MWTFKVLLNFFKVNKTEREFFSVGYRCLEFALLRMAVRGIVGGGKKGENDDALGRFEFQESRGPCKATK